MTQTSFVESCAKTTTGSAAAVARRSRGRPKAKQLLKLLADKKRILITTHAHPDPDLGGSSHGHPDAYQHTLRHEYSNGYTNIGLLLIDLLAG